MGHEIGYHYENLSYTNGDYKKALYDFEKNLDKFRNIVPVYTVSMHGRPLSKFDNRDLWNHYGVSVLCDKYHLLGEIYLSIDYSNIAYINDTGRNWNTNSSNLRDKTNSEINIRIDNNKELMQNIIKQKFPQIVFQIHPERWTNGFLEYCVQFLRDYSSNFLKYLLKYLRN